MPVAWLRKGHDARRPGRCRSSGRAVRPSFDIYLAAPRVRLGDDVCEKLDEALVIATNAGARSPKASCAHEGCLPTAFSVILVLLVVAVADMKACIPGFMHTSLPSVARLRHKRRKLQLMRPAGPVLSVQVVERLRDFDRVDREIGVLLDPRIRPRSR